MVTTIQLSNELKSTLSNLKENSRETYEEFILNLIKNYELTNSKQEELLKQGYLKLNLLNSEINDEFDQLYSELD